MPDKFLEKLNDIERSQLKRGWNSAIASIGKSIEFDEAFKVIVKYIRLLDSL